MSWNGARLVMERDDEQESVNFFLTQLDTLPTEKVLGISHWACLRGFPSEEEDVWELAEIAVSPKQRQQGCATFLIQKFIEYARSEGGTEIRVQDDSDRSNDTQHNVYCKCGFVVFNSDPQDKRLYL
jgi:GNAT superfamily N-acetyltransferase